MKFLTTFAPKLTTAMAVWLVVLVVTAACDSAEVENSADDASANTTAKPTSSSSVSSVPGPPDSDWNWQLTGQLDMSVGAEVWDIDLFETDPEVIGQLHRDGRYVICYFSAGTVEDWRPDVGGINKSIVGLPLDDWPGEKWLDIRDEAALKLVESRLGMANQAGCDAVEPDNVDGYSNQTGFSLSQSDQVLFNTAIAQAAHARGLAVGLKNAFDLVEILSGQFDFAVTEQCHQYDECELLEPFLQREKPVFNAEYPADRASGAALRDEYCAEADRLGIHTLILPIDLDGSWRLSCG